MKCCSESCNTLFALFPKVKYYLSTSFQHLGQTSAGFNTYRYLQVRFAIKRIQVRSSLCTLHHLQLPLTLPFQFFFHETSMVWLLVLRRDLPLLLAPPTSHERLLHRSSSSNFNFDVHLISRRCCFGLRRFKRCDFVFGALASSLDFFRASEETMMASSTLKCRFGKSLVLISSSTCLPMFPCLSVVLIPGGAFYLRCLNTCITTLSFIIWALYWQDRCISFSNHSRRSIVFDNSLWTHCEIFAGFKISRLRSVLKEAVLSPGTFHTLRAARPETPMRKEWMTEHGREHDSADLVPVIA